MNNNDNIYETEPLKKQLQENTRWFYWLGVSLVLLGSMAIIFSYISTLVSVMYCGFFMITVGFFHAVKSYKIRLWSTFLLHLLLSILYIGCGLFIVAYPALSAISITIVLTLFFILSGILKIIFALRCHMCHASWLLLNGLVTLLLGIWIWSQLPVSGLWILGTLLGIEVVITGWTFIMLSFYGKNMVERR